MQLTFSDEILAGFLGGLLSVFTILGIGALIYLVLYKMSRRYPFIRLAISLSLAPLTMVQFLERDAGSILYLYIMAIMLIGLLIDGLSYILFFSRAAKGPLNAEDDDSAKDPDGLVWERAE